MVAVPMTRLVRPSVMLRTRMLKPMVAVRGYPGKDIGPNKTHTTDKPGNDVQSESSQQGRQERAEGTGNSSATAGKDSNDSHKKAKDEFPEAPDTIGMVDERGGKGA